MTETVLVTGGTGFVGGWCIVELLKRGYAVRTTVRNLSKERAARAAIAAGIDPNDRLTLDRLTFLGADLTSDTGWDDAVAGCDYVLHVASPLGGDSPKDADTLILPAARDGTLRVLRAATNAKVRRIVLTSSCAAASPPLAGPDSVNDEAVWTDTADPTLNAYRKSKVLAEQAAWEFMRHYDGPATLTTILPGAVFGPVLSRENPGSVQIIGRLLQGRVPGNPRLGFDIVDVRDLADVHLRAMTTPQAAGQRFIATGEFMWMAEVSQALRAELGASASKVPTRALPSFVLRLMARFDAGVRAVTPGLGRRHRHISEKAQRLLAWRPRPATETVVDCARSLIAQGVV
jgi:dihydroflavonol-4-reductase